MSFNSVQIVHQLQHDFQELVEYMTSKEAETQTAYEIELTLFRRLLKLGAQLLRLFFVHRAAVRPEEPVYAPDGTRLKYQSLRRTTYYSVFGKVRFKRHYFHTPGQEGFCPLDAELSLPPRCYSDLLRDWAEYCITDESYDDSIRVLKRILTLSISKRALEVGVAEDAADVNAFYEQKPVPPLDAEGSILVVQADGKGVPMVRTEPANQPVRLGKGEKRTKKKEAVVTGIYTIQPHLRTPEQVVKALLHDIDGDEESRAVTTSQPQRPTPVGKELRATLAGKDIAFERLTERVVQREGVHIQHRVALTDGDDALQRRVSNGLSKFTLVLDIIHSSEYLWDAANALLGETHPDRTTWVKKHLLCVLSGKTTDVIHTLEQERQNPALSSSQRKTVDTTIGYYQRNLPYMQYDQYLARGWPIGTGVVEGACGHLVKDRMEQSGMRWLPPGAQAVLDLRAARINDDWDDYHHFRRQQQHHRLYGDYSAIPPPSETFVLRKVA